MRVMDLDQVIAIDRLSFRVPWLPSAYLAELANPNAHYVVARSGGAVVGYGGIWRDGLEAHLTTLAVHPDNRGQNIGARLLATLLAESARQGAQWMELEVRAANRAAQELYRQFGFRVVRVQDGYYTDNGEAALIMRLDGLQTDAVAQALRKTTAESLGS